MNSNFTMGGILLNYLKTVKVGISSSIGNNLYSFRQFFTFGRTEYEKCLVGITTGHFYFVEAAFFFLQYSFIAYLPEPEMDVLRYFTRKSYIAFPRRKAIFVILNPKRQMKKIYSPVFIAIALLTSLLLSSCEKETPSVGSTQDIYGSWECRTAPSNSNAHFIKGDILTFDDGYYMLVHPDGKEENGFFIFDSISFTLCPGGSKGIDFSVKRLDTSTLDIMQLEGSLDFSFIRKKS